jgi:hypothetical protein
MTGAKVYCLFPLVLTTADRAVAKKLVALSGLRGKDGSLFLAQPEHTVVSRAVSPVSL